MLEKLAAVEARYEELNRLMADPQVVTNPDLLRLISLEPDVRRMLEHSDFLFAYATPDNERLIGFARVLSDRVYKDQAEFVDKGLSFLIQLRRDIQKNPFTSQTGKIY